MENNGIFAVLEEILIDAIRVPFGNTLSKSFLKKIRNSIYASKVNCAKQSPYSYCLEILESYAQIVFVNNMDTIIALTSSGYLGLNPVVMVIEVKNQEIHLLTMAKEGLINQHTAERAASLFATYICENLN